MRLPVASLGHLLNADDWMDFSNGQAFVSEFSGAGHSRTAAVYQLPAKVVRAWGFLDKRVFRWQGSTTSSGLLDSVFLLFVHRERTEFSFLRGCCLVPRTKFVIRLPEPMGKSTFVLSLTKFLVFLLSFEDDHSSFPRLNLWRHRS